MKPRKLLSLLLALTLALGVFPLTAHASETYDLTIAGVQVTDENKADVLGDGAFRYDSDTKTLTIDGIRYSKEMDYVLDSGIDGLTIDAKWDSQLHGDRYGVLLRGDTTITGGKLTITTAQAPYSSALKTTANLTVLDAELIVDGKGGAMTGTAANQSKLMIINSSLSSKTGYKPSQGGAVIGFSGGIALEGCRFTKPESAYIKGGTVTYGSGGDRCTEIVIEPLGGRQEVKLGDYLQMGTYYGAPILWRCVAVDQNGPLMLSDKILCLKAYDAKTSIRVDSHRRDPYGDREQYGANFWTSSNLRSWLNSEADAGQVVWRCKNPPSAAYVGGGLNAYDTEAGFLTNFSTLELAALKKVTQKCVVAEIETYSDGEEPYAPEPAGEPSPTGTAGSTLKRIYGNYDRAWSTQVTDRVFLLDVTQLLAVYDNADTLGYDYYFGRVSEAAAEFCEYRSEDLAAGALWQYWLRTPVTDTGAAVYAMYPDGTIEGEDEEPGGRAFDSEYGVRPAFYLDTEAAAVGQGAGTEESPYVVF